MNFRHFARALGVLGILAPTLLTAPEASAHYVVGYSGTATAIPVGASNGDTIWNGPTTLCTPAGTLACGALAGDNATSYSRASISDGALDVVLTGDTAWGWTYVLMNGKVLGLSGDDGGPGMDAILHVTYGWSIFGAGSMRLQAQGSGGFNPPVSIDTGNVPVSRTETEMALRANIAAYDGYSFQFTLDFGGVSYAQNNSLVAGHLRFWLELPEGGTLSTANFGVGGVPLSAQVSTPAPAGAVILPGLLALAAMRWGGRM